MRVQSVGAPCTARVPKAAASNLSLGHAAKVVAAGAIEAQILNGQALSDLGKCVRVCVWGG